MAVSVSISPPWARWGGGEDVAVDVEEFAGASPRVGFALGIHPHFDATRYRRNFCRPCEVYWLTARDEKNPECWSCGRSNRFEAL